MSTNNGQTSFQDLPVEFRKNGYPQLVEECKDVLKAAYMAQNKLGTFYEDIGLR